MHAAQSGIGDDAMARAAQAVAEIDVFARRQRGVESADALERRSLDREIAAAEPGHILAPARARPQAVVLLLDPVRRCGLASDRRSPVAATVGIGQHVDRGLDPVAIDLVVRIRRRR